MTLAWTTHCKTRKNRAWRAAAPSRGAARARRRRPKEPMSQSHSLKARLLLVLVIRKFGQFASSDRYKRRRGRRPGKHSYNRVCEFAQLSAVHDGHDDGLRPAGRLAQWPCLLCSLHEHLWYCQGAG